MERAMQDPVNECLRATYLEIIDQGAQALDGFGRVVAFGAERMVAAAKPWLGVGSPEHEQCADFVVRSVVLHMAMEHATYQTTVDAAERITRLHGVKPSGRTYIWDLSDNAPLVVVGF
jgi:hypothetical protein